MRKIVVISMIILDDILQAPGGPEDDPSDGFKYGVWTTPYGDEFSNELIGKQLGPAM